MAKAAGYRGLRCFDGGSSRDSRAEFTGTAGTESQVSTSYVKTIEVFWTYDSADAPATSTRVVTLNDDGGFTRMALALVYSDPSYLWRWRIRETDSAYALTNVDQTSQATSGVWTHSVLRWESNGSVTIEAYEADVGASFPSGYSNVSSGAVTKFSNGLYPVGGGPATADTGYSDHQLLDRPANDQTFWGKVALYRFWSTARTDAELDHYSTRHVANDATGLLHEFNMATSPISDQDQNVSFTVTDGATGGPRFATLESGRWPHPFIQAIQLSGG